MKKVEDYYPITTRRTPEGDEMVFITNKDLKDYTKPEDYQSLSDFLFGQTRYIEGVYHYDVERWLNRKK